MKNILGLSALLSLSAIACVAQIVTLDNFNSGTTSGQIISVANGWGNDSTWIGKVTSTASAIVVSAGDDNGWGAQRLSLDATGSNYVAITGELNTGNLAQYFTVQITDGSTLATEVYSVPTSSFLTNSMSTVYISLAGSSLDWSNIVSWTIGGGTTNGATAFKMTIDNLALTSSAVPEPATYAGIFGFIALGFVAYRRRRIAA